MLLTILGLVLTVGAYVGASRTAIADEAVTAWVWAGSLPAGQMVTRDDVRPVRLLRRDRLPGLDVDPNAWQGMVTAVAVGKGEAVTRHDVQSAAAIPPGWSPYVLALSPTTLMDPALLPGDRVDVLVSEHLPGGQSGASRIATGAIFLAAQSQDGGRLHLLRLAVPPEAAEQLLAAEAGGRQVRILRSAGGLIT